MKIAVLGSGEGSNMQALLDAIESGDLPAEIALVLSDVKQSGILERAKAAGIAYREIDCRGFRQKFPQEAQEEVVSLLKEARVDLVCLAGFMRLVGKPILDAFPKRVLNIHPSLLPAYPGFMAWKQAIDDGASESGCTVHYVDEGMDTGEVILQAKVPVLPDDTADSLHARIQLEERRIYLEAVRKVIANAD